MRIRLSTPRDGTLPHPDFDIEHPWHGDFCMPEDRPVINRVGAAFHGYIGAELEPPSGYGFGFSFYVTVFALLRQSLTNFTVGLPSAWIKPQNQGVTFPLCPVGTFAKDEADREKRDGLPPDWSTREKANFTDVFQIIEGGLGIWSDTRFPTETPKYRINGIPDCYTRTIGSPGWPFGNIKTLADADLTLAQLSNQIIIPPDGMTFAKGSENQRVGLAWMALPLTDYDGYFLLQTKKAIAEDGLIPRTTCLRRNPGGGGTLDALAKAAQPSDDHLWSLVPSNQKGYFWLKNRGWDTPAKFGGGDLWKLVSAGDDYYYLQTSKDGSKVLGGTAAVTMAGRSNDPAHQLWKLVPQAVKNNVQDATQHVATGDSSWTLFLNAENFKGPVAFFLPKTWSRISRLNPEAVGRGLDARPAAMGNPSMEVNSVPGFHVRYLSLDYLRIPPLLFPTETRKEKGVTKLVTPLMQDIMVYSREAIYAPMMSAFEKGSAPASEFQKKGAAANKFTRGEEMRLDGPGPFGKTRIDLKGISDLVEITYLGDGKTCAWGLLWKEPPAGSGFRKGEFPEYFEDGLAVSSVPDGSTLSYQRFDTTDDNTEDVYTSPAAVDRKLWKRDNAWTSPGPLPDFQKVLLADGSEVLVAWYEFKSQPALANLSLTSDQKAALQARVVLLHKKWKIKNRFMDPPSFGKLVSMDPGLIVKPPKGYEEGYVPIVIRQGWPKTGGR
jgi:hypothetical protein